MGTSTDGREAFDGDHGVGDRPDGGSDPWDESAAEWDDDPAARAYAEAVFGSLVTVLDERRMGLAGARVIDFGCGTGLLTERLAGSVESIDAVDTSSAMLGVLTEKVAARGWNHVRSGHDIPSSPGTHDLVVCSSVCGFLEDYPGTLRRLADLLRPGGLFVQWDWERDDSDDETHGLSRAEIEHAIDSAGLVRVLVDTAFEVPIDGEVMRPLIGVGQKPGPVSPSVSRSSTRRSRRAAG